MRPGTDLAAGLIALARTEHAGRRAAAASPRWRCVAALAHITLIHRRRHSDRRLGRQAQRAEQIIGVAARPAAPENRRWPARSAPAPPSAPARCVPWPLRPPHPTGRVRTGRPDTAWKVVGGHELARAGGHDHLHLGAALAQAAHEVRALVGGDAAGHAEQNAFALHGTRVTFAAAIIATAPATTAGIMRFCAHPSCRVDRQIRDSLYWPCRRRLGPAQTAGPAHGTPCN